MLLAAAAYKIADTAEAIDTLTRMASQRQHVDRLLVTGMGENTEIEFSPTDPTMVSLTNFNGIELWDVKRGVRLHSRRDADGVDSSAFSPDGRILVYTQNAEQGKQGVLWFYEDDRVQEIPLSLAPDEPLGNLTFSPDGKLLGACIGQQIRGQRIQLWSLDPSGPRHSIPLIHGAQCAFGFRGGSRELAYTNGDDIVTWDIAASRVITSKTPGPPKSKRPGPRMSIGSDNQFLFDSGSTFAVAPDGRSAMYRGNEGDDAWWDFDRQEALAIGMSTSFPNDLSFTPDSRLATMVLWGGIMLFDVARRMPIAVYSSVDNRSTALSPDGRMIATINDSGLITLIDTSLHQGIPARADRVGIQPDNEHLTTVSSGKVTIYSLGNHESTIVRNPEGDRLNGGRVENLSQNGLRYAFMDDQAKKRSACSISRLCPHQR